MNPRKFLEPRKTEDIDYKSSHILSNRLCFTKRVLSVRLGKAVRDSKTNRDNNSYQVVPCNIKSKVKISTQLF